jgi:cephalosporin-C deacetylase
MTMHSTPYADDPARPVLYDLDIDLLQTYLPARREPTDFDVFWRSSVEGAQRWPLGVVFEPTATPLRNVDVLDVTFNGFGGNPIKAWLILPAGHRGETLPCVVQYVGYSGGRGAAIEHLTWACAGYAHMVVDARGQGGDTADTDQDFAAPSDGAHVTRGLADPLTYYYRRAIVDAVRAVEAARAHPSVDAARVVVSGTSQGGGIALAAAALADDVAAALVDIPFLCDWRRAVRLADRGPYADVARHCAGPPEHVERIMRTLDYFDGMFFSRRSTAPAIFSVALMDRVCPPSTVYAAFNNYAGAKGMDVYEFNDHEGGGVTQTLKQMQFLSTLWQSAD